MRKHSLGEGISTDHFRGKKIARLAKEHICIANGHRQQCGKGRPEVQEKGWVEVGKGGGNGGDL